MIWQPFSSKVAEIDLKFKFFKKFEEIFKHPARFKVITKGRRVGFTHHCAIYLIENALENQGKGFKALWGDTTHENVVRYVERYFMPYLKQIPQEAIEWRFLKNEKKLMIGDAVIDFRSADKPQNWEGFGYDLIILNEAGIILKNRYLWENAVRPMLLDNPNSRAIIGGVPKGKNLFYELWQKASTGELGDQWAAFSLTTYDNPLIDPKEIENLKKELGDERIIRQEIYGEFIDADETYLFNYEDLIQATKLQHQPDGVEVWGLDVGLTHDEAVLVKRRGRCVYEIKTWRGLGDAMALANIVAEEFYRSPIKPYRIYVDTIGIGWGVADRLIEKGMPAAHANFAEGTKSGFQQYKNKRAEAYFRLQEEISKGGLKIPEDSLLLSELAILRYTHDKKTGKIVIIPKEEIKQELGRSPDRADALALTFYEPLLFVKPEPEIDIPSYSL